ncbi:MAG: hypothetical protein ABIQ95_04080 [Bdellovibrionia bacterium]
MTNFLTISIILVTLLITGSVPNASYASESESGDPETSPRTPFGPIQVITSGPNEPITYAPIEETACQVVEHLPGNYEYHLCSSENGSSVPTCRFISMVEFVRIRGNDETFQVVERPIGGAGEGRLTGFHFVQLWNHSGCTLIYADDNKAPTWNGANTYMSDSNTIILAFHAGSIGLLKKIQDFPIHSRPRTRPKNF